MSDVSLQTLFATLAVGMLLGGLPAWFFTAIHWYRKGMADSRYIWEHALGEATKATVATSRDAIDSWITKSDEMVARHRKGGSPAGGADK